MLILRSKPNFSSVKNNDDQGEKTQNIICVNPRLNGRAGVKSERKNHGTIF